MQEKKLKPIFQDRIDAILRKAYLEIAEIETEAELETHPMKEEIGFCHIFWSTKKSILKEKYGVDWMTPAEEDPNVMYD